MVPVDGQDTQELVSESPVFTKSVSVIGVGFDYGLRAEGKGKIATSNNALRGKGGVGFDGSIAIRIGARIGYNGGFYFDPVLKITKNEWKAR